MNNQGLSFNINLMRPVAILVVLNVVACAAAEKRVKMDADRPIETDRGYRQDGQLLETRDMTDKLEREPASTSHVQRSRALMIVSIILAGAGGALIGVPLGQKLRGSANPTWELAYAGAGAVVLSLPLGFWSQSSMTSAIEAHNSLLGGAPVAGSR